VNYANSEIISVRVCTDENANFINLHPNGLIPGCQIPDLKGIVIVIKKKALTITLTNVYAFQANE
jgi:hypothetical protein